MKTNSITQDSLDSLKVRTESHPYLNPCHIRGTCEPERCLINMCSSLQVPRIKEFWANSYSNGNFLSLPPFLLPSLCLPPSLSLLTPFLFPFPPPSALPSLPLSPLPPSQPSLQNSFTSVFSVTIMTHTLNQVQTQTF